MKIRTFLIIGLLIFSISSILFAEELNDFIIIHLQIGSKETYVNGEKKILDCLPIISSGRTLVPLRFISENMGGEISYNSLTREITLKFKNIIKISNQLEERNTTIENLKKEITRLESETVDKQKKLDILEEENKRYKEDNDNKASEIQNLKEETQKNKETIDLLKAEVFEKGEEINTLSKELTELKSDLEKLKKEMEEYKKNSIKVSFPNIEITFFGKKITPVVKPFVYNEKVMVSLEDIATAMNVKYRYDSTTGKIVFGDVPKVAKIGQRLIKAPYAITVHGKRIAKKFVIVEATIENLGNEMIYVNSQLNFSIEDGESRRFDSDIFAGGEIKNNLAGEIKPGYKLRGEIGFEMEYKPGLVFWYRPFNEKEIYFTILLD